MTARSQVPKALAVDLGGTHVELALVEPSGRLLAQQTLETRALPTPEDLAEALAAWHAELGRPAGVVGIGAPNGVFARGTLEAAPNLPWPRVVPLVELVEAATGLPAVLDNDANAAALGAGLGAGQGGPCEGLQDYAVVTLGTGLGAGLVSGGQLVRGASGRAGELGHVLAEPGGRLCGCGRRGCLETYVSAGGLVASYQELQGSQPGAPASARQLAERARSGDALARTAFAETGHRLAQALCDLTLLLAPSKILFTGGLAASGELLFEPTRARYLELLPSAIEPALFGAHPGGQLALLGAAALGFARLDW